MSEITKRIKNTHTGQILFISDFSDLNGNEKVISRALSSEEKRGNVIVVCPPEEFHDLGARMVSDFFTINGFHTVFVGSNTPFEDFYQAVEILKPDVVAISVSNYYNLVVTKKIITAIREKIKNPVQIIVGGNAFLDKPDQYKVIGADSYAVTYEDIQSLCVGKGAVQ